MHHEGLGSWQLSHQFLGDTHERHEARTRMVLVLTATMMVVEIAAGTIYGSMALLADGWHMATHTGAFGVTALAYAYARRNADNRSFSFGSAKVGDLAGFSSALFLAVVSLYMGYESAIRLLTPVSIHYAAALPIAGVGLAVNLLSAVLLRDHDHHHEHDEREHGHTHHDHNLRAAYLHVIADAFTSLLAVFALAAGQFYGWSWMDPAMGIVGGIVIARWSYALMRDTARVLLDVDPVPAATDRIRRVVESDADTRIADLHVWRVGPGHLAVVASVVTHAPRSPDHYKALITSELKASHITVEVNACN